MPGLANVVSRADVIVPNKRVGRRGTRSSDNATGVTAVLIRRKLTNALLDAIDGLAGVGVAFVVEVRARGDFAGTSFRVAVLLLAGEKVVIRRTVRSADPEFAASVNGELVGVTAIFVDGTRVKGDAPVTTTNRVTVTAAVGTTRSSHEETETRGDIDGVSEGELVGSPVPDQVVWVIIEDGSHLLREEIRGVDNGNDCVSERSSVGDGGRDLGVVVEIPTIRNDNDDTGDGGGSVGLELSDGLVDGKIDTAHADTTDSVVATVTRRGHQANATVNTGLGGTTVQITEDLDLGVVVLHESDVGGGHVELADEFADVALDGTTNIRLEDIRSIDEDDDVEVTAALAASGLFEECGSPRVNIGGDEYDVGEVHDTTIVPVSTDRLALCIEVKVVDSLLDTAQRSVVSVGCVFGDGDVGTVDPELHSSGQGRVIIRESGRILGGIRKLVEKLSLVGTNEGLFALRGRVTTSGLREEVLTVVIVGTLGLEGVKLDETSRGSGDLPGTIIPRVTEVSTVDDSTVSSGVGDLNVGSEGGTNEGSGIRGEVAILDAADVRKGLKRDVLSTPRSGTLDFVGLNDVDGVKVTTKVTSGVGVGKAINADVNANNESVVGTKTSNVVDD